MLKSGSSSGQRMAACRAQSLVRACVMLTGALALAAPAAEMDTPWALK